MAVFMKVVGGNVFPEDSAQSKAKQPSRKTFNLNWNAVNEYEHEIANHYRDYKNRKKLHRGRRRRRYHQQKVFFEEQLCYYRDVLKVSRLNFPESSLGVPQPDLDNLYDNTLRRISNANSLTELKFLTKREERLHKYRQRQGSSNGPITHCSNYSQTAVFTVNRQKRNSLGHIRSDIRTSAHSKNKLICNKPTGSGDNKVSCEVVSPDEPFRKEFSKDNGSFFHILASECYDEGFLAHIKYLKSIASRNALNNQISKRKKPRHTSENTNYHSQPQSAVSSVSSSNSVEEDLSIANNSVGVRRFSSAVKQLINNSYVDRSLSNYNKTLQGGAYQHRDLKICANISRSLSLESLNSNRSSSQILQYTTTEGKHNIMSEIFSGEPNEIAVKNNCSTVKRQHFHDLIENLNNLEISNSGLLPKIVLTDFSTVSPEADDCFKPLPSATHEKTIHKQNSLEIDLPNIDDYNSEARPP